MDEMEPLGMFDELMSRGERLRQLRLLAIADEKARHNEGKKKKHTKKNQDNASVNIITHGSMDLIGTKSGMLPSFSSVANLTATTNGSSNNSLIDDNNDGCFKHESKDEECDFIIYSEDDEDDESDRDEMEDRIDTLPDSKLRILRYDSYLKHQRYNDDYKHADCHFIDFGNVQDISQGSQIGQYNRLIIEQQKSLGKGGFVWDAGVILADHLIASNKEWVTECMMTKETSMSSTAAMPKVVELGAGTGVTGLMIAKAIRSHVYITDLPDVMRLMERNAERNFHSNCIRRSNSFNHLTDDDLTRMDRGVAAQEVPTVRNLSSPDVTSYVSTNDEKVMYYHYDNEEGSSYTIQSRDTKQAEGIVTAKVLRWGVKDDYADGPFDVVIAGDVVTTLYDPSALAQTIYDLSHKNSIVYICVKQRLNECHENFEEAMNALFASVTFATPITRHRNLNNISVMRATHRRTL